MAWDVLRVTGASCQQRWGVVVGMGCGEAGGVGA